MRINNKTSKKYNMTRDDIAVIITDIISDIDNVDTNVSTFALLVQLEEIRERLSELKDRVTELQYKMPKMPRSR